MKTLLTATALTVLAFLSLTPEAAAQKISVKTNDFTIKKPANFDPVVQLDFVVLLATQLRSEALSGVKQMKKLAIGDANRQFMIQGLEQVASKAKSLADTKSAPNPAKSSVQGKAILLTNNQIVQQLQTLKAKAATLGNEQAVRIVNDCIEASNKLTAAL